MSEKQAPQKQQEKAEQPQGMSESQAREYKNAVLKAKEASETGGPMEVSREEYARRELGLDIPVDAVPLPTGGKIYGPEHPLHGKNKLEYRAMTAKEEDILMSQAYIKKGTVISELIKSCAMDRALDPQTLLSGDRNAIMIAIRISGYGRDYRPQMSCPNCDNNNELQVDLADLPIKPLELEPAEAYNNLFHFKLPRTGKTVGFKFLTGAEEEDMLKTMEAKRKKGFLNTNLVTTKLLHTIVEIDGVKDRSQIAKFVQHMPAADSQALRDYIDNNEPGVDMTVDFICQMCDHTREVNLPFGPSFFWPNLG